MKPIIVDNFYSDPDYVRSQALALDYPFYSTYPGKRSYGPTDDVYQEAKEKIEKALGTVLNNWDKFVSGTRSPSMNGCFQSCFEGAQTWIHHDHTQWAGVVYLDPNPNPDSGTGFFKHKSTGIEQFIPLDFSTDLNRSWECKFPEFWDLVYEVKNQYNRAVIYPGGLYHRSMVPGYGNTIANGRLTQVFFFN